MILRRTKKIARWVVIAIGLFAVLFEEAVWRVTSFATATIGRSSIVASCEAFLGRLPPYIALPLVVVPYLALLPVKGIGVYWMATGAFFSGVTLLTLCEILGIAVVARLYVVCRPSLHKLSWFLICESFLISCSRWAHGIVETIFSRFPIKRYMQRFNKKTTRLIRKITGQSKR